MRLRHCVYAVAIAVCWLLSACTPHRPAPIEDRTSTSKHSVANRPVPDFYRVKRGDTLYSIAFAYALTYQSIACNNNIAAPYTIYPGQRLRIKSLRPCPPASKASHVPPKPRLKVATKTERPKVAKPTQPVPSASSGQVKKDRAIPPKPKPQPPTVITTKTVAAGGWRWPTQGRVISRYNAADPAKNGLDITGREGQPILATRSGSVVYSGNGLIGYGELVIVKHDDQHLSAYAHNRKRWVKEGDQVKAGQQIAEMGRNGQREVLLHFEIRVNGRPVDPQRFLP